MNELLLSLVASPGGNDAITGLMAKAPPGESPPVTTASFLQVLLQSMPAPQVESPVAALLGGMSAEPAPASAVLAADDPVPASDGTEVTDPEEGSLPALQMAVLAGTIPALLLPEVEPVPTESGSTPGAGTRDVSPARAAAIDAAFLEQPPPASPLRSAMAQALELEELVPAEINAEIPAPETREGSASQKEQRPEVSPEPASRTNVRGAVLWDVPARAAQEADPEASVTGQSGREVQRSAMTARPPVLPHAMPEVIMDDRQAVGPAVRPPAQPDLASSARGGKGDRTAEETSPAQSGNPGRRVNGLRLDRVSVDEVPPAEEEPSRPVVRRHSGGEQPVETRPLPSGKGAERGFLLNLPEVPESTAQPVASVEKKTEQPAVAESHAEAPAAEPARPQAAHTGPATPVRESADAVRQAVGPLQPHQLKEPGDAAPARDGQAAALRLHGKLTEELSRSVLDQVVKHVALQVRGEMSEMRIRLDPPSLGEIQVTVRVEEGRMQAQIDVTQPAVRTALETQVPQLRQTLTDQGIEVHRIDVYTSGSSMSRESHEGHGNRPRRRDGGRLQGSLEGVEQYRGARMMGYNTIEMVM